MKGNVYIVKTTENFWKLVVGLSHPKHSILVKMKGNEYKGTGAIQKVEVCLDHHEEKKTFSKWKEKNISLRVQEPFKNQE